MKNRLLFRAGDLESFHFERIGAWLLTGPDFFYRLPCCYHTRENVTFEYGAAWLEDANRFSIEPALALTGSSRAIIKRLKILSRGEYFAVRVKTHDSSSGVVFSLSTKLDGGLLHTQQQTLEFTQRSGIYGQEQTVRQTKPRSVAGLNCIMFDQC